MQGLGRVSLRHLSCGKLSFIANTNKSFALATSLCGLKYYHRATIQPWPIKTEQRHPRSRDGLVEGDLVLTVLKPGGSRAQSLRRRELGRSRLHCSLRRIHPSPGSISQSSTAQPGKPSSILICPAALFVQVIESIPVLPIWKLSERYEMMQSIAVIIN